VTVVKCWLTVSSHPIRSSIDAPRSCALGGSFRLCGILVMTGNGCCICPGCGRLKCCSRLNCLPLLTLTITIIAVFVLTVVFIFVVLRIFVILRIFVFIVFFVLRLFMFSPKIAFEEAIIFYTKFIQILARWSHLLYAYFVVHLYVNFSHH
jgi:hypothetical protein